MFLDENSTLEDIFNHKKTEIQNYLKAKGQKISGNKLELAKRAHEVNKNETIRPRSTSPACQHSADVEIVSIESLKSGWTSNKDLMPNISHSDVEKYLLHSSHRTEDSEKMECYRQFIRGYNFFKEGYVHKVMINLISDESKSCYIRSKCNPSMKQGAYDQWIVLSKEAPVEILKAYCSCPAGLGEGCTHIAGLLFSIESFKVDTNNTETPCTSKPCEWSKPSKRKREADTVKNIPFKRIRFGKENAFKARSEFPAPLSNESFRTQLCCKLSNNNSNAVLLQLITPKPNADEEVYSDLNVCSFEEVVTSELITYPSDGYINVKTLIDRCKTADEVIKETSHVPPEIASELEERSRGQNDNPLWKAARKCRITSSNFHDVYVKKPSTSSEKLVDKFMGKDCDVIDTPALRWGKKYEPVAKERYIAHNKLFNKEKVTVQECGLFLHKHLAYLGSSPDGLLYDKNNNVQKVLEIKCPYSAREKTIIDACKMKGFCCTYNEETNSVSLKLNHRYYSQVQGQMAICGINKCDFVVYTKIDFKIIEIAFDSEHWDELKNKLQIFYRDHMVPALLLSNK